MSYKMAINTSLSTIESKTQNKINKQSRNGITDTEIILMVARWEWGQGDGLKR